MTMGNQQMSVGNELMNKPKMRLPQQRPTSAEDQLEQDNESGGQLMHAHSGHSAPHPVALRHRATSMDPLHKDEDKLVDEYKNLYEKAGQGLCTGVDLMRLREIKGQLRELQGKRQAEAQKIASAFGGMEQKGFRVDPSGAMSADYAAPLDQDKDELGHGSEKRGQGSPGMPVGHPHGPGHSHLGQNRPHEHKPSLEGTPGHGVDEERARMDAFREKHAYPRITPTGGKGGFAERSQPHEAMKDLTGLAGRFNSGEFEGPNGISNLITEAISFANKHGIDPTKVGPMVAQAAAKMKGQAGSAPRTHRHGTVHGGDGHQHQQGGMTMGHSHEPGEGFGHGRLSVDPFGENPAGRQMRKPKPQMRKSAGGQVRMEGDDNLPGSEYELKYDNDRKEPLLTEPRAYKNGDEIEPGKVIPENDGPEDYVDRTSSVWESEDDSELTHVAFPDNVIDAPKLVKNASALWVGYRGPQQKAVN